MLSCVTLYYAHLMDVDGNMLYGVIPEEISHLPDLEVLNLCK